MVEYVAGFLFDVNNSWVVLIQKNKPEWQKGRWNAVGGKIERGELPIDAMQREFLEETGVSIEGWKTLTVLEGRGFRVYFYFAHAPFTEVMKVKSVTDEKVSMIRMEDVKFLNTIPNIQWLVPMALSMKHETVKSFVVQEVI